MSEWRNDRCPSNNDGFAGYVWIMYRGEPTLRKVDQVGPKDYWHPVAGCPVPEPYRADNERPERKTSFGDSSRYIEQLPTDPPVLDEFLEAVDGLMELIQLHSAPMDLVAAYYRVEKSR